MLEDPIGEDGLKVDDARRVVELLMSTPVGSAKGVVVIGPMDLANWKSADVLLKTIEEFDDRVVVPVLWWCPRNEDAEEDDELVAAGYDLVHAAVSGELWQVPGLVKQFKGREHELLGAAVDALQEEMADEGHRKLWGRLRGVSMHRNPTPIEITVALLGDS